MKKEHNFESTTVSNSVVENTERIPLSACVDWFSCTFNSIENPKKIIELLSLRDCPFTPFDTGKYGYPYHLRFGHIGIYYGGEDFTTCYLDISGQGCREFEENSTFSWSDFFAVILMLDIKVTRLDLAIDDKKGYFTINKIKKKIAKKVGPDGVEFTETRSKFKRARVLEEYLLADGENLGQTVYFGSVHSEIQVRFYDKLKQVLNKKKTKKEREELKNELGFTHWVRSEMQLRDDRAYMAVKMISEHDDDNLQKQVLGHFRQYIHFVDRDITDSNKSRWKMSKWWEKFLQDVEALPLTQKAPDVSVEKSKDWLFRSVTANLDMVLAAYNYDLQLFADMIINGTHKQKKKHVNMLKAFKGKDFDFNEIIEKRNDLLENLIKIKKEQSEKDESL